jgi:hypothetical protein
MKHHLIALMIVLLALPTAIHAQLVVSAPAVEAQQAHKNIFDQIKYAWEQSQWADKLATLHSTLTTVREQLETANMVKQAIGDPMAVVGLIDNGLFSEYLADSGIPETLEQLAGIAQEGAALSATINELFQPIDMSAWENLPQEALGSFEGVASFRDPADPLARFRAVENAYTRFEEVIGQAQAKRKVLNQQISRLNLQLKAAADDAEVQKLVGSLQGAQSALDDLDHITTTAQQQMQMLHVLNQNRAAAEEVAAEEISREENRRSAEEAAAAEASLPQPIDIPL